MSLLALAGPALATAKTFKVTTTADGLPIPGEEVCGGAIGEPCTLREAINSANGNPGPDEISFAELDVGSQIKVEEAQLPPLTEQVTVDADTALGATPGLPAIELVPINFVGGTEFVPGLEVQGSEKTKIEGFAIGGFGIGIEVALEESDNPLETEICGDYLGTQLNGELANPNEVGIEVRGTSPGERAEATRIGGAGCGGAENVISGNSVAGIVDEGLGTKIAGNRIGIGAAPDGAALGNGNGSDESAGIVVGASAVGTVIGGGERNLIYDNDGPGVLVESAVTEARIEGNSFSDNHGKGIEIVGPGAPTAPTGVAAESPSGAELKVTGLIAASSAAGETVRLEVFANDDCSKAGEGRTFLGFGDATPPGTEAVEFSIGMPVVVPADEKGITVTATHENGGTSEFSTCANYAGTPRNIVVNSLADTETAGGCELATTCTLRGAIELANETEVEDTIKFAAGAEGVIDVGPEALPKIEAPVLIDGTSAPGYAAARRPVVEIDGAGAGSDGPLIGLLLLGGESAVEGVSIVGFRESGGFPGIGIVADSSDSRICSDWIGVGLNGAADADGIGIEVVGETVGNKIGVGCGLGAAPNVIAGNEEWGIEDSGEGTEIGGNVIGVLPSGSIEGGNAEGGIRVGRFASRPDIGGDDSLGEALGSNTIAYNGGPGVLVETGSSAASIRGNAIYGNAGKGIVIEEGPPAVPTIESVTAVTGAITVKGAVFSGEQEPIELDVFASAVCGPPAAAQGETLLGEGEIAESAPLSSNPFSATVPAPSDDQLYITVTATAGLGHRTSEFSECFKYVPPEPEKEPEAEPEHHEETHSPAQNNGTTPPTPTPTLTPTNGEKVVVKPEEGTVKIKLSGKGKYVRLEELKQIPVGAIIDATKGRVTLTSIGPNGEEQTAEFFGGVFKVKQAEGSNLVVLELLDETVCKAPKPKGNKQGKGASPRAFASSVSLRPSGRTSGKLWGSGHGNFRTEGDAGSATVRGTIWLVEDRCNGTTFFKTRSGIVSVRDFVLHKTLPLPAGKTYVAGE